MKQINKHELDELIRVSKKYWNTRDETILEPRIDLARKMSYEMYGSQIAWFSLTDLIDGCINLNEHISNTEIYRIFEILGYSIEEKEGEYEN